MEDQENSLVTMAALEEKVPLMFRFLSNEDDDVSGAVAPFVQEYISVLKQMKQMSPKQREHIEVLWIVFIRTLLCKCFCPPLEIKFELFDC
jgi:hypothetical protein